MLIHIQGLLNKAQLGEIRAELDQAEFVDGKLTAGSVAAHAKNNEELPSSDDRVGRLGAVIMSSMNNHWTFKAGVMSVSNTTPIFSRYTPNMSYGLHLDASLSEGVGSHSDPLIPPKRFRTDMSSTVFLSEPDEYEGGELEIHTPVGVASIKYAAGDVVLYPSTYLHQVNTVTSGTRLVCVCWYQCAVRDVEKRGLLYELNVASSGLLDRHPNDPATMKVNQVLHNLLRRWGET